MNVRTLLLLNSTVALTRLARPAGAFETVGTVGTVGPGVVGRVTPGLPPPGSTVADLAPSGTSTTKRSPIVIRRGVIKNWVGTSRPRLGSPNSSPAVWQVRGRKKCQGLRAPGPRIGTRLSLRPIALMVVPQMAS